ncbi:MAG: sulfur carrier protein ThiS [Proteobacteria bacterium]|nr:sulfur carrier protein ThiS [Pseudomonadota bacterium]MBU1715734.1 sulfur carrier protein ThiS [Pseudomonadota bacterium]
MEIICNSEPRQVAEGISLEKYILDLDLNPNTVVAEYNGQIVRREDYADYIMEEGAILELIRFVGGG